MSTVYKGIIYLTDDWYWDLIFLTKDEKKQKEVFNKLVEELKQNDPIDSEAIDIISFESGQELWEVEAKGEDCSQKDRWVIISEVSEGYKLNSVHCCLRSAEEELDKIKKEYLEEGFAIYRESDDLVVFNNDDVFKIQKIPLDTLFI